MNVNELSNKNIITYDLNFCKEIAARVAAIISYNF